MVEVAVRDLVDLVLDSADAGVPLVRAVALVVAIERDGHVQNAWVALSVRRECKRCLQRGTHQPGAGPSQFQTRTNRHLSSAAREGLTVSSLVTG